LRILQRLEVIEFFAILLGLAIFAVIGFTFWRMFKDVR